MITYPGEHLPDNHITVDSEVDSKHGKLAYILQLTWDTKLLFIRYFAVVYESFILANKNRIPLVKPESHIAVIYSSICSFLIISFDESKIEQSTEAENFQPNDPSYYYPVYATR